MNGIWGLVIAIGLAAQGALADEPTERSFEFTYEVTVESIPKSAESIRVWIPIPQTTAYQTISNVRVNHASKSRFAYEERLGNKFLIVKGQPGADNFSFSMVVDVRRFQRSNLSGDAAAVATALEDREMYLTPSAMVRTDGRIAEEALRVVGNEQEPLLQARALYDHIVETVEYDKSGEGWGRGDSTYACDVRKGNCTDFHSLFIGEAISLGVPSRFLMGFPVPSDAPEGEIGGYHCWAEFFIEGRGWIPIDASEAFKDPSRRDELFGGLDVNRVQFTMGRDIVLPGMQGPAVNYSIYPYAEVDGVSHEAITRSFRYRDLKSGAE